MNKKRPLLCSLLIAAALALPIVTEAQTGTDTNLVPPQAQNFLDFATTLSNYWAAPFFTVAPKSKDFGGGVAIGANLSPVINPVFRIDDFAHQLYVVSGNLELKPPQSVLGKFPITPFALGGVATAFGGNAGQNGGLSGVVGAGAYFEWSHLGSSWLCQHAFTAVDYERWFNLPSAQQNQIRIAPFCLRF